MKNKTDIINNISEKQKNYDLSLINDNFNYNDTLQIICHEKDSLGREHGVFTTNFNHFVNRGDCCPKCNGKYMDKELFLYEAKKIHGDNYNYDEFEFQNKNSKSIIYCNRHHIPFLQTAKKHLMGHGCPKCRYENSGKHKRNDPSFFVEKAKMIHGDKYDYSKTNFVKYDEEVIIICHEKDAFGVEHGEFKMLPGNHLHKTHPQGCPICGAKNSSLARRKTYQDFENAASIIHNGKYTYHQDYVTQDIKVNITCPKHGDFPMLPYNHLNGQGCPTCGLVFTLPEKEIIALLKSILGEDTEIIIHSRQIIKPFELDIYIPKYHIGIEYNGLVWHSEKFATDYKLKHLRKLNICKDNGIRLIQIFEDEWLFKKDIVISRLKSIFGIYNKILYARKCQIKNVDYKIATEFLNQNHLQGFCPSQIQYGLYYNDELVSLMTFGHVRQMKKYNDHYDKMFELLRFAVKQNLTIIGGASKLLKHFMVNNEYSEIISYADKRWSNGDLYYKLGFEHTHDSKPNYFYVDGKIRKNRFNFRKGNLVKKGYDETKSEHEIMLENGLYRIYDCGTMVFSIKK